MTNLACPDPSAFTTVSGLNFKGLFYSTKIEYSRLGHVLWMRGTLDTLDTGSGLPTDISFTTPYPASLPFRWVVADFISWLITHEMMEGVALNGAPLFDGRRMLRDHETWKLSPWTLETKLRKVEARFQDDAQCGRWKERGDRFKTLSDAFFLVASEGEGG